MKKFILAMVLAFMGLVVPQTAAALTTTTMTLACTPSTFAALDTPYITCTATLNVGATGNVVFGTVGYPTTAAGSITSGIANQPYSYASTGPGTYTANATYAGDSNYSSAYATTTVTIVSGAYVTVQAGFMHDSSGNAINGTIYFQPQASNAAAAYQRAGGGFTTNQTVFASITGGAFSIQLPNSYHSSPPNMCLSVSATQTYYPKIPLLGAGYTCVQPHWTATSPTDWCQQGVCNLDYYTPNLVPNTLQSYGPTGPMGPPGPAGVLNIRGLWQVSTNYAVGDAYTNSGTLYVVTANYTSGSTFGSTDTANTGSLSTGLSVSGGTMTGALVLAANPLSYFQAATKGYVDDQLTITNNNATTEQSARITAVAAANAAIATETTNRTTAVATNTTAISTEATARAAADTTLTTAVAAAASTASGAATTAAAASSAATANTAAITTEVGRAESVESALSTAIAGASGSVNPGTANCYAYFPSTANTVGPDCTLLDTGTMLDVDVPIAIGDGTTAGGYASATEGTGQGAAAGIDNWWADSTAHRWVFNQNNGGNYYFAGVGTPITPGHFWMAAANGIDLADGGVGGSAMSGVGSHAFDTGGGGSGGSITYSTGFSDSGGFITLTTGTSTGASAGIMTWTFSTTYGFTPICHAWPANNAANGLASIPLITYTSITTTGYILYSGTTAVPASNSGGPFIFGISCKKPGA